MVLHDLIPVCHDLMWYLVVEDAEDCLHENFNRMTTIVRTSLGDDDDDDAKTNQSIRFMFAFKHIPLSSSDIQLQF